MSDGPIDEEHIKRFRSIIRSGYPKVIKEKKSLKIRGEVSGDRQLLNSCSILQSGEIISRGHGHNPCEKVLDDFEELVESG